MSLIRCPDGGFRPSPKKSNCVTNPPPPTSPGDSDVSLTPPNSPTGNTPRQPLRSRGVRGANRTNKTKKALAKLKRTVESEKPKRGGKKKAANKSNVVVEDGGEVSSEEEEVEEDELEMKVKWKTGIIRVTACKGEKAGKVICSLSVLCKQIFSLFIVQYSTV